MKKTNKFLTGGKVNNYIENPGTELTKLQINMSKARDEVNNDNFLNGFDLFSQIAPSLMSGMYSGGSDDGSWDSAGMEVKPGAKVERAATGGNISKPVEIERGEVVHKPDGGLLDFTKYGKSHEKGGIPLSSEDAPPGSEVHSARIKIGGKTMAEIKLGFEKSLSKYDKLLADDPTNKNLKKTKELFNAGYKKVNERNMLIQNALKQANNYMASGGTVDDLDEDAMADLQEYASQNDMDLEQAYDEIYNQDEEEDDISEEQDPNEQEQDGNSDDMSQDDSYDNTQDDSQEYIQNNQDDQDDEEFATGGNIGDPISGKYPTWKGSNNNFTNDYETMAMYRAIAEKNNTTLNFDDPNSIKAFQKLVGTKADGSFGADSYSKSVGYMMDKKDNLKKSYYAPSISEAPPEYTGGNSVADARMNTMGIIPESQPEFTSNNTTEDNNTKSSGYDNILGGLSAGDLTGMLGTAYGAIAGRNNTEANRAGDKPNINSFLNYGADALKTFEKSGEGLNFSKDEAMKNLNLNRNAALSRGRNGARSINTSRALDLATDAGINTQEGKVLSNHAAQVSQLMQGKARLQSEIDFRKMSGEQLRDMNDRKDRDAYYSNKGADAQSLATGMQKLGKHMNEPIERNMNAQLLSELSDFFGVKVTGKGLEMGGKEDAKKFKESILNKIFKKKK